MHCPFFKRLAHSCSLEKLRRGKNINIFKYIICKHPSFVVLYSPQILKLIWDYQIFVLFLGIYIFSLHLWTKWLTKQTVLITVSCNRNSATEWYFLSLKYSWCDPKIFKWSMAYKLLVAHRIFCNMLWDHCYNLIFHPPQWKPWCAWFGCCLTHLAIMLFMFCFKITCNYASSITKFSNCLQDQNTIRKLRWISCSHSYK